MNYQHISQKSRDRYGKFVADCDQLDTDLGKGHIDGREYSRIWGELEVAYNEDISSLEETGLFCEEICPV